MEFFIYYIILIFLIFSYFFNAFRVRFVNVKLYIYITIVPHTREIPILDIAASLLNVITIATTYTGK